jgi:hypothetical protein
METVIDRLVQLVQSEGAASISDASKALAVSPVQIEKLAMVLEDSGLLRIRYTLRGPRLFAVQAPKTEVLKRIGNAKKRYADRLLEDAQRLERDVKDSESIFRFMERDVLKHLEDAKRVLRAVDRERSGLNAQNIDTIKREIGAARRLCVMLEREIDSLRAGVEKSDAAIAALEKRVAVERVAPRQGLLKRIAKLLRRK